MSTLHFSNLVLNTGKSIKIVASFLKDVSLGVLSKTKYLPLFWAINYGGGYMLSPVLSKYYMNDEIEYTKVIEKNLVKNGINYDTDVDMVGFSTSLMALNRDTISAGSFLPYVNNCSVIINRDLKNKVSLFSSNYTRQVSYVYNHESAHCHMLKNDYHEGVSGLNQVENILLDRMITHFKHQSNNIHLDIKMKDFLKNVDNKTSKIVYLNFMEGFADVRAIMVMAKNPDIGTSDVFYKEASLVLSNRIVYNYLIDSSDMGMSFSTHDTAFAIKVLLDNFSFKELNQIKTSEYNDIAYQIALASTLIKMAENFSDKDIHEVNDYLKKRVGFSDVDIKIFNRMLKSTKEKGIDLEIKAITNNTIEKRFDIKLSQQSFKEFSDFKNKIGSKNKNANMGSLIGSVYDIADLYANKALMLNDAEGSNLLAIKSKNI